MAQFKSLVPDVEVNGETVFSVIDGMGVFRTMAVQILTRNGIDDPKAGQWYSQQAWLDAFRVISETIGAVTLHAIGRKIPENAQFPTNIDSVESALQSIDIAYHMNHRLQGKVMYDRHTKKMTEGIGHYYYEKLGENKAQMVCDNPYPCDFDQGIIEAMARRFKPSGSLFVSVQHDDRVRCRKKGGDRCTYLIEW